MGSGRPGAVGDGVTEGEGAAVAITLAVGDAARVAGAAGEAGAEAVVGGDGVAIGPAGAGVFWASCATVSSMDRSIGIRATPLLLSTQA